jgi:uncharacterized membrane protein
MAEIMSEGGSFIWVVLWVGFLALLAWGAISAIRWRRPQTPCSPDQILKERLARGEIDTDEYYRVRELIDDDVPYST